MICVSLAEEGLARCLAALKDLPFAEIRLDRTRLTIAEVGMLFSRHPNLVATCRPGTLPDEERKTLLFEAIRAGAAFVDVELDGPAGHGAEIVERARSAGCSVIVSFHDHEGTPVREGLARRIDECFGLGADIAKIACTVRTQGENARLLGLLDDSRKIVVVGMGQRGGVTRIVAPLLGSPFTFASLSAQRQTAEGQIDHGTLARAMEIVRREAAGEDRR